MRANRARIVGRFKKRDAVEFTVKEGSVKWEGVYWRKPEGWANVIYEWLIVSARLWQVWEDADDGGG